MQILKKLFLVMTSSLHHKYPYDTDHGVVINRGNFDACIFSSFRGVNADRQTHRQTDRIALYLLDYKSNKEMKFFFLEINYFVVKFLNKILFKLNAN